MTDLGESTSGGPRPPEAHIGELGLRRFFAGEQLGARHDGVAAHVVACPECRRRLDLLGEEQRAFEEQISYDRFAAGVERAGRVPRNVPSRHWWKRPASTRSFLTVMSIGAVAAGFALVVGVRPLFQNARRHAAADADLTSRNRSKGGAHATVTVRIAPREGGSQRTAAAEGSESLAVGDRLRVGVAPGARRFLFAISVDDQGTVTPLYPEVGTSMPLPRGGRMQYLPDSLELTGKGGERLVVLLSDEPLDLDTIGRAVAAAFLRANGHLEQMPALALPGEQVHRMFTKP